MYATSRHPRGEGIPAPTRSVARAIAICLLAGEEFLLVMPGAASQRPFVPLERLKQSIAGIPFTYAGSAIRVTASVGVAWMSGRADTAEMLLSRADAALYGAKQAGRNRVEYAASG
jgi:diguanylate cyclase (GGDEF)-like protein